MHHQQQKVHHQKLRQQEVHNPHAGADVARRDLSMQEMKEKKFMTELTAARQRVAAVEASNSTRARKAAGVDVILHRRWMKMGRQWDRSVNDTLT